MCVWPSYRLYGHTKQTAPFILIATSMVNKILCLMQFYAQFDHLLMRRQCECALNTVMITSDTHIINIPAY